MTEQLSKAGIYHSNDPLQNQDAIAVDENSRFLTATLADGVSECSEAGTGARIVCHAVNDLLLKKGSYFLELESRYTADFILRHIQYELNKEAEEAGIELNEYSSTVASILLDKKSKKMMLFNLGDSLILAAESGKCNILAMPAESCFGCPSTTTENVSAAIYTKVIDASPYNSLLICSDGAWKHMYERDRMKPEVKELLLNSDCAGLNAFLYAQNCTDDYSYIYINMD